MLKPSYPAIIVGMLSAGSIGLAILDAEIRPAVIEVSKLAVAGYIGYACHTPDENLLGK